MNKQAKLKQDQDVAKDDLTIILSYPHVYRFKPICYGMIVAVLNCHSSVITIMEKVIVSAMLPLPFMGE